MWRNDNLSLSGQYLHNEKRLLHGDIKSCNVVVMGDFDTVKICDVGVSLQLDENMKGRRPIGLFEKLTVANRLAVVPPLPSDLYNE